MDSEQSKGKEKMHSRDSLSQYSVRTNKRHQPLVPEPKPIDVSVQQNPYAFWKIRDIKGWEHGVMIDENRQHWKCRYCFMIGYSGGVSGLKRHLVGDREAKKCLAVPEHVSVEIKHLMDAKKEKRQKRAAEKGGNNGNSRRPSDNGKDKMDLLPPDSDVSTGINTHVLEGVTNQTKTDHELQDLKIASRDISMLANSFPCLTGTSSRKEESSLQQAMVTYSEPKDLIRSNTLISSTSQGLIQSSRPDSTEVYEKRCTCNSCGKEARGHRVLTCNRCILVRHISCIEPLQSVSTGSWYCESCSSTMKESAEGSVVLAHDQTSFSHGTSVACKKLEVCRPPNYQDSVSEEAENSRAIVVSGKEPAEVLKLSKTATSRCCKICGDLEEYSKRFLICGYSHCLYKYYHIQCLNWKQIASEAQWVKTCWYCPSCLCRVCLSNKDDDQIIMCDGCDEGHHLYCLTPPLSSVPEGEWYCSFCTAERAKEGTEYEQMMLRLHEKDEAVVHLVDIMLSAAEELSMEEKSVTVTK